MISLLSIPKGTVIITADDVNVSSCCVVKVTSVSSLETATFVINAPNLISNGFSVPVPWAKLKKNNKLHVQIQRHVSYVETEFKLTN